MLKTFAQMVNNCGGINGRQLDLAVVEQAGGAADQATTLANAQAACIKATEDEKPFIVMTWTGFAAPQCITDDHKTLMLDGLVTQNEYLKTAQGRHILFGNTNEVAQYQAPMLDLLEERQAQGQEGRGALPHLHDGHRSDQGQRHRSAEVEGRQRRVLRHRSRPTRRVTSRRSTRCSSTS